MTEVHEDRTEDEILYKSMKARNNIAFEILLKTDNFTNLPVTQLPVLLGQCIPTHTKSVIRSGLASLAQIVQDRKLLILHGFHKGVLSQKRHQYFIDILEKMKGMLARQEDDRVSEGDKSCQPCESTTSSQKCLAPDEENGIFQEVCDDTMSANELYTLFDFVESTIDQMLKTWKTARAGKCDVASAAGVHLYQTIKSYLAGNFLDEHYIYDELLTLEHPLMARFREADKAVLQFKDGANTQCAMFLYNLMLYLGEARRPNFVSPPAHDLALRLAEASDVWARVLVGVSCSILLELNATWSPEEIECHRTLVSTRAEGLIATIKFLNDINREQASQRERTISELQYCMELKECIGNVTEIFTIGYLGAQIAANMHHLLVLHLDWPDLSALAHLHAYGDLKGWRPPPGCDMGFCDEFENLLFLNGRPRSIEACKVGLRMWIRGRRAQEVYNGRASHLTPCLFKKLLEREYREQGDLPIRHRLALAIQRSLGPAILLQLQLDWDLHRYPSLLDIWQALMTATHSSRVSQSAEVIYRVLSKGMDAKSVLDAFGQDFSRRWLSRMGARLGENDIEANANHLAALFGEGHI